MRECARLCVQSGPSGWRVPVCISPPTPPHPAPAACSCTPPAVRGWAAVRPTLCECLAGTPARKLHALRGPHLHNSPCAHVLSPPQDYFFDDANVANGGNRWATILMYLTTPEEGGETGACACRAGAALGPGWRCSDRRQPDGSCPSTRAIPSNHLPITSPAPCRAARPTARPTQCSPTSRRPPSRRGRRGTASAPWRAWR